MFDPTIRVHGAGKWTRDAEGVWRVEDFLISTFETLDDDSLVEVINQLRNIPAQWKEQDDPAGEMSKIRDGGF
jgi:hypothetical protein